MAQLLCAVQQKNNRHWRVKSIDLVSSAVMCLHGVAFRVLPEARLCASFGVRERKRATTFQLHFRVKGQSMQTATFTLYFTFTLLIPEAGHRAQRCTDDAITVVY